MTASSRVPNLREVGGTGLQDDRARTVYRAATETGVAKSAYPSGLVAVVDLRRGDEVRAVTHPLAAAPGYRNVPLFDPSTIESDAAAVQLEDQYADWLDRHATGIAAALRTIGSTDGDVLVCCSAGKDRTGVVSALLARLWGASLERIGTDYAASGAALVDRFAAERAEYRRRGHRGCAALRPRGHDDRHRTGRAPVGERRRVPPGHRSHGR